MGWILQEDGKRFQAEGRWCECVKTPRQGQQDQPQHLGRWTVGLEPWAGWQAGLKQAVESGLGSKSTGRLWRDLNKAAATPPHPRFGRSEQAGKASGHMCRVPKGPRWRGLPWNWGLGEARVLLKAGLSGSKGGEARPPWKARFEGWEGLLWLALSPFRLL